MDDYSSETEFEGEVYDEEEYEYIPYEPEEPEEILSFGVSLVEKLIERVIPDIRRPLTLEKAGKCLQILGKVWNLTEYPPPNYINDFLCGDFGKKLMDMEGYVDDYQYLHIEAVDLLLTDIRILPQHFIWLLSANLSGNRLNNVSACPLTKLPNLVALKLNGNRIDDPYLPPMKHLQYLGLNSNKIESLHRIYHPNLETLALNFNRIRKVYASDCWKHTKLNQLELRGNLLKSTSGIEFSSLVNLYLAQNKITELKGLEILVNLQRLHLRENPLTQLTGFSESNQNLKYLNLRKCLIQSIDEITNLSVLKGLKELVIMGNLFNPEPKKRRKRKSDSRYDVDEEYDEYDDDDDDDDEDYDDDDDDDEEKEEDEYELDDEYGGNEEENQGAREMDDDEIRLTVLILIPTLTRIDKTPVTLEEKRRMRDAIS